MTQMNVSMKQKQTHRHREQTCGCLWVEGGQAQTGRLELAASSFSWSKSQIFFRLFICSYVA